MSTPIPSTMKAFIIGGRSMIWPLQAAFGGYSNRAELVTRPVPTPGAGDLLVKVDYYAANPTDTLHLDYIGPAGSILGCDFVGTVVSAGSGATLHKVGDKIFGVIHGGKYPDIGSAAEYCIVADDLAITVPKDVKLEDAPTFGVGFITAAAVLYDSQKIPMPPAKVEGSPWYFVSGGATSVGMFAIQLARLAGFKVIASASERNFDLLRSYGADEVVSYADHAKALKQIADLTQGGVTHAIDCVGGKANLRFAVNAFGTKGGKITSILPGGKSHRKEVQLEDLVLYRYLGKAFSFIPLIMSFGPSPEKRIFFVDIASKATGIIETYGIKPNPVQVEKGMEALPAGWDLLRKKKVSGKKLIFDFRS